MPRRVTLPGADELFRTTGGTALTPAPRVPEPAQAADAAVPEHGPADPAGAEHGGQNAAPHVLPGRRPLTPPAGLPGTPPLPSSPSPSPHPAGGGVAGASGRTAGVIPGQSGAPVLPLNGRQGAGAPSAPGTAQAAPGPSGTPAAAPAAAAPSGRSRQRKSRPTGRERHEEKITVYVSAEELLDLEHARLVLRGEHGLAVDRGRIVREAVAVVLADLEQRGEASILVRRLRGR